MQRLLARQGLSSAIAIEAAQPPLTASNSPNAATGPSSAHSSGRVVSTNPFKERTPTATATFVTKESSSKLPPNDFKLREAEAAIHLKSTSQTTNNPFADTKVHDTIQSNSNKLTSYLKELEDYLQVSQLHCLSSLAVVS